MAAELDLRHDAKLSLFETVIRVVGGLLSAYDASHDTVFLDRADELGSAVMRNFLNDGTGEASELLCGMLLTMLPGAVLACKHARPAPEQAL